MHAIDIIFLHKINTEIKCIFNFDMKLNKLHYN